MTLLDALSKLSRLSFGVFQTSDAAACLRISPSTASKILSRLNSAKMLIHLARARWAFPTLADKLIIPEHLTAPWPSYISLQTALHHHGLINQIPSVTYAVSLNRTRVYKTEMGVFSIHQLKPDFFFGYETIGISGIKLATPEKALLDILYLSPARSLLFKTLPEVEISRRFRISFAREMIEKITSKQRRSLVKNRFEGLITPSN